MRCIALISMLSVYFLIFIHFTPLSQLRSYTHLGMFYDYGVKHCPALTLRELPQVNYTAQEVYLFTRTPISMHKNNRNIFRKLLLLTECLFTCALQSLNIPVSILSFVFISVVCHITRFQFCGVNEVLNRNPNIYQHNVQFQEGCHADVIVRKPPYLGQNRWFIEPFNLQIWRMTLKNNRAHLLCYFKLCALFHHHLWIQTGVTVQKRLSLWPWPLTSDLDLLHGPHPCHW